MSDTLPNTSLNHDRRQWIAADFFSTYRYWALFTALFLMDWAGGLFAAHMPMALRDIATRLDQSFTPIAQLMNSYYLAQNCGWVIGVLLAVATLRRGAWPVLATQIILCAACAATIFLPLSISYPEGALGAALHLHLLFGLYGLALGTLRAALMIIAVSSLISGRSRRVDFAFAFCLLLAPPVLGIALGSLTNGLITTWGLDLSVLAYGMAAAFIGMALILVPARRLAFDDRPRVRHAPPERPSRPAAAWIPVAVGLLTLVALTGILIICALYMLGIWYWRRNDPEVLLFIVWLAALAVLVLAGVVYMAFWFYRIHRQAAALMPSPRLLTPAAAAVFALLAPLGMPLALLLLRDALDAHTDKASGSTASLPAKPPGAWFVVWVLLLPPIAMGMAQHRVNMISRVYPGETAQAA